jgi:MFS family permease
MHRASFAAAAARGLKRYGATPLDGGRRSDARAYLIQVKAFAQPRLTVRLGNAALEIAMSTVETSGQNVIDVPELIGSHKLGRYQIWILVLCAILMFSSGFNMLTLGYLAPAVTADLKLHAGELGIVFVVMGVASVTGAFTWGPIADRIGRRRAILIALGWRSVFLFNAFMPLILVLIALFLLPESLKQLVRRPGTSPRIAEILARMYPDQNITADSKFISSEKQQHGFPVRMLFTDGRAAFTSLLWTMGFANMISLFFMNSWLTTVLHNAGFVLGTAILIAAVVHIG